MKRQRNTQQIKEQDKCPPNQTKEEEKKEEGDRGGQKDKKGGMKRRETHPASNQFPKCSPQSGTHRNLQSWVE